MSTYHPKTLKRWKVHKRSLVDLRDKTDPAAPQLTRSQVIHSLELDPAGRPPAYPCKRESYSLEEGRNRSLRLSNGFRKLRREHTLLAFSKVVSEEHFIRVDFAAEEKNNQRVTLNGYLPRKLPRSKKSVLMRNQARRAEVNCALKDLLQVKQPFQVEPTEILQIDGEEGGLPLLEEEAFRPYRIRKQPKREEAQLPQRPIHFRPALPVERAREKREDLTSESLANFMSISEIDLKAKQGMRLVVGKRRSFSVMDIVCRKDCQAATRYSRKLNAEIEPWQTDK